MKPPTALLVLSLPFCACADSSRETAGESIGSTASTLSTSDATSALDTTTGSTGGTIDTTTGSTGGSVDTTADRPTGTTGASTGDSDSAPKPDVGVSGASACDAPVDGALVYFDDFETVVAGESFVGRGANGFVWSDAAYVSGSVLNASSGSRAAAFTFLGGGDEASSELRFDLGGDYREVTIEFRLYMPDGEEAYGGAAYRHRNNKNNKFFRLWPGSPADYNSGEKLGASLWGMEVDSESLLMGDWSKDGSGSVGPGLTQDPAPGFLGAADHGAWQTIRIDVRAATAKGSGPAALAIGKNGEVLSDEAPDNFTEGESHSFRFGYLLGYANSGFDEDTLVFIDDVCVIARP